VRCPFHLGAIIEKELMKLKLIFITLICLCLPALAQDGVKSTVTSSLPPSISASPLQTLQLNNLILSADKLEAEIQAKMAQKQLMVERVRGLIKEIAKQQNVDLDKYVVAMTGGNEFVYDDNGNLQFVLKKGENK
jgi:hypothetical protein